jgi:hypothetical protein
MSSSDDIQRSVERKLKDLLKNGTEAKKEDLQVLSLSIKYLAVKAKLSEEDWGKDLEQDEALQDP